MSYPQYDTKPDPPSAPPQTERPFFHFVVFVRFMVDCISKARFITFFVSRQRALPPQDPIRSTPMTQSGQPTNDPVGIPCNHGWTQMSTDQNCSQPHPPTAASGSPDSARQSASSQTKSHFQRGPALTPNQTHSNQIKPLPAQRGEGGAQRRVRRCRARADLKRIDAGWLHEP
jgi:hypothetical protein